MNKSKNKVSLTGIVCMLVIWAGCMYTAGVSARMGRPLAGIAALLVLLAHEVSYGDSFT
jgi:hypothetical protein